MIKADDVDVLLEEPETADDKHEKLMGVIDKLLKDEPAPQMMEFEVELLEAAIQKLSSRAEEARQNMIKDDELLSLANLRMNSEAPSSPAPTSSGVSMYSDDVELDITLSVSEESDCEEPVPDEQRESTPQQKSRPPIIYLSSDSEEEDCKDAIIINHRSSQITPQMPARGANVSNRDFPASLTRENPYLKMKSLPIPFHIDLEYPLGVTHDDVTNSWYMTDSRKKIVLRIRIMADKQKGSEYAPIKNPLLMQPSAICVLKEGSQIAVLCENKYKNPAIRVIDIHTEKVGDFCSSEDDALDFRYQSRGLARSKGGNLITMDRTPHGEARLRVFTRELRQKTFELKDCSVPSFIASSGDTVVITDLGSRQKVLHVKLDDSVWSDVNFQILRVISDININLKANEMLNKQYFLYVAGAQIDKHGNIIIADAKNHHFKLFKPSMGFIHRISTDFPVPYVSSFHVNQDGEIMILSTREDKKLHFAKLTATNRLEPHIAAPTVRRRAVVRSYLDKPRRANSRDSQRSEKPKRPKIPKIHD